MKNKTRLFALKMQNVTQNVAFFMQNACCFASQSVQQMLCNLPYNLCAICIANRYANCEQKDGVFYRV